MSRLELAEFRPLVRPAPRSAMFFPLVVLIAVLPGLYALKSWDLDPPGPWWGLRGVLALEGWWWDQVDAAGLVADGAEASAFRNVAYQPPLYAWLEAATLLLSPRRDPVATVLPSYAAGVLLVVLVYALGRNWLGRGVGLLAALLTGFHHALLVSMQHASPTTLGVTGAVVALLAYDRHLRSLGDDHTWAWPVLGGVGLAVSFLSMRNLAWLVPLIVVLHQASLGASTAWSGSLRGRWWRSVLANPSLQAGAAAMGLALLLVLPWYGSMFWAHGWAFLASLLEPADGYPPTEIPGPIASFTALAPATLPLALYTAARNLRHALAAEADDPLTVGGSLWVLWLGVAAVAPVFWPAVPWPALELWQLLPLNLLAAQGIVDLAARRIPAGRLVWLVPATVFTVAWWGSANVRLAISELLRGERPDAASALAAHLVIDVVIVLALGLRWLNRWARQRDVRRRLVLGAFLMGVLTLSVGLGLREIPFRRAENADLLALRQTIVRQDRMAPFRQIVLVGTRAAVSGPTMYGRPLLGGRLRFVLRTALPRLNPLELPNTESLQLLEPDRRLIIVVGPDLRVSPSDRARLELEAVAPESGGLFTAFVGQSATPKPSPAAQVRAGRGR